MSKNITSILVSIIVVLTVILGYVSFRSTRFVPSKNSNNISVISSPSEDDKQPTLIGGQKDEHGCLVAAGYSWCDAKQKCIRPWEEKCSSDSTLPENTAPSNNEDLIQAVKKVLIAEHGPDASALNVTVKINDGKYAQGGASAQGGGGMWFAEKVNGEWKLIWDGNGIILCTDLIDYPDFPNTLIPECYDKATDTLEKR